MSHAENHVDQLVVLTTQNKVLYDMLIRMIDTAEEKIGLSSEFTQMRNQAEALAKEVPKGPQPGSPDFTAIAQVCDARTGWHIKDALAQAFLHEARQQLAKQFPGLVMLEVDFRRSVCEHKARSYRLAWAAATFDGGHYITFRDDDAVRNLPFALVLSGSSANNTDELQGRAEDAARLGSREPTQEAMQERIDLISAYFETYFSHVAPEQGLSTVYERRA